MTQMNCEFCDTIVTIALTVQGQYKPKKSGRLIETHGDWSCYILYVCDYHQLPYREFGKKRCCIHGSRRI
jgi:hypothetical protein